MTQFEPSKSEQRNSFGAAHNVITDLENDKISVDVACNRLILLAEQVNWKQLEQWLQQQEVSSRLSHNNYHAIMDMLSPVISTDDEAFTDPFVKSKDSTNSNTASQHAFHHQNHYQEDVPPSYHEPDEEEYQPLSEEEMNNIPIEAPRQEHTKQPKEPSMFFTIIGGLTVIGGIIGLTVYLSYDKIDALIHPNSSLTQQSIEQPLTPPPSDSTPQNRFNFQFDVNSIPFLDRLKDIPYIADLPFIKDIRTQEESSSTQQTLNVPTSPQTTGLTTTERGNLEQQTKTQHVALQKTPEQLAMRIEEAVQTGLTTTNAKAVCELLFALIDIDKNAVKTKALRGQVASHLLKRAQLARDENKSANANFFVDLALSVNQYGKSTY